MATNLAAQPSNAPLPTGITLSKRAADYGSVSWPGVDNYLWMGPGAGNVGGNTGIFNRPERFWLKAGASLITLPTGTGWIGYVYAMRLVVNGGYNNDLNGIGIFTKYNSVETHSDSWWGSSIESLFYCEKNTNYEVYLLSRYGGGNVYYYQSNGHMNMWAYTIGEGAY